MAFVDLHQQRGYCTRNRAMFTRRARPRFGAFNARSTIHLGYNLINVCAKRRYAAGRDFEDLINDVHIDKSTLALYM